MFFKKKAITSNATRDTYALNSPWYKQKLDKHLAVKYKYSAGRSHMGRLICRTKSSLKKKLTKIKIFSLFYYTNPACFLSYYYQPKTHRFLYLSVTSSGWLTYIPATTYRSLFSYIFINRNFVLKNYFLNSNIFFLFQIHKSIRVNNIEDGLTNTVKYITSNGSTGKLLSTNLSAFSILVQLPSGAKKIYSRYTKASLGYVLLDKRNYKNTKSGYWRNFGWKSIVRGVAMNPVDHPHGGRTKSIRYPRTPWGFTTKYK